MIVRALMISATVFTFMATAVLAQNTNDPNLRGPAPVDTSHQTNTPLTTQTNPTSPVQNYGTVGNHRCPEGMYQSGNNCVNPHQSSSGGGGSH
jgi:hypothetical protein